MALTSVLTNEKPKNKIKPRYKRRNFKNPRVNID
jgi:hypothetical protein